MREGQMKRNLRITISGWAVRIVEVLSLLISMRYLSPETIGGIYIAVAFRELALRFVNLSGIQDHVHRDNDQLNTTNVTQIRRNFGGLIIFLMPIFLVFGFILLPLTLIQFLLISLYVAGGLTSYAMTTMWNLTNRKIWYVSALTQIPGSLVFAFSIWILASNGYSELDIACFAMASRAAAKFGITCVFARQTLPLFFGPIELILKRFWYVFFGLSSSVAKNWPAFLEVATGAIDSATLGLFSRGIKFSEAFYQPISKLNSVLMAQYINRSQISEVEAWRILLLSSLAVVAMGILAFPVIHLVLGFLIEAVGGESWSLLLDLFIYPYALCGVMAVRRFWEKYAWTTNDSVRGLTYLSIFSLALLAITLFTFAVLKVDFGLINLTLLSMIYSLVVISGALFIRRIYAHD
jgi:hypothetical protein